MRLKKKKTKLFWVINFSVLAMFTLYAMAVSFSFGSKQAYADALNKDGFAHRSNHFVVVNSDQDDTTVPQGSEQICSLTPVQASELGAFFRVNTFPVNIGSGSSVEVATVTGAHLTKSELENFLKASNQSLDCQVITVHHIFFLPVIPQIS